MRYFSRSVLGYFSKSGDNRWSRLMFGQHEAFAYRHTLIPSTTIIHMETWSSVSLDRRFARAAWYRPIRKVRARQLERVTEWATANGSRLRGKAGDWELTDGTRTWTVAADIFAKTYTEVAPHTYQKTGRVQAVRAVEDALIPTLEGEASIRAGDWVVRGVDGEVWPVPDSEFAEAYEILAMP